MTDQTEWKSKILANVVGKSPKIDDITFYNLWAYQHTYAIRAIMMEYELDPDNSQQFFDMALYLYETNPELCESENRN